MIGFVGLSVFIVIIAVATSGKPQSPVPKAVPTAISHNLTGTMSVYQNRLSHMEVGQTCNGHNGYDDLKAGAAVVVKDQSGTILSTGALGFGTKAGAVPTFPCDFFLAVIGLRMSPSIK